MTEPNEKPIDLQESPVHPEDESPAAGESLAHAAEPGPDGPTVETVPAEESEPIAESVAIADPAPALREDDVPVDVSPPPPQGDGDLHAEYAEQPPTGIADDDGELLAAGRAWGFVDDEGNVRQKDGRIVGRADGDPDAALRAYAFKYRQIVGKIDALERDVERSEDKTRYLGRIHAMLQWVPTADALGDLDGLVARLRDLESSSERQLGENLAKKEALAARAEELAESTDWKATGDAMKGLQTEWKAIGPVPKDKADEVWARFRGAMDRFFERRKEHFDQQDREQQENLVKKEALCVRAEELAESTDWKATTEAMKTLQDEWKAAGPVPKDKAEEVWKRFRAPMDHFFERRKEHYRRIEKEQKENLRRKEALCVSAEELAESTDWKATGEALKALQAEWKTIGPVPRNKGEALWERFHGACDRFFTRRSAHFAQAKGERAQRQAEWRERMQETLDRKRDQADRLRDSIARDEENVQRWQGNLARLRPGPGSAETRAELEGKISDVENRLQSKRARLEEIEASIQEIAAKL